MVPVTACDHSVMAVRFDPPGRHEHTWQRVATVLVKQQTLRSDACGSQSHGHHGRLGGRVSADRAGTENRRVRIPTRGVEAVADPSGQGVRRRPIRSDRGAEDHDEGLTHAPILARQAGEAPPPRSRFIGGWCSSMRSTRSASRTARVTFSRVRMAAPT